MGGCNVITRVALGIRGKKRVLTKETDDGRSDISMILKERSDARQSSEAGEANKQFSPKTFKLSLF